MKLKKLVVSIISLAMMASLAGCAKDEAKEVKKEEVKIEKTASKEEVKKEEPKKEETKEETKTEDVKNEDEFEPFTITTYKHEVTFNKIPEKVISYNQFTTEMLLALGLEDKIIGTCYLDDAPYPEFAEAFNKIPVLADKYPSFEIVLANEADFVTGMPSAFSDRITTIDVLKENNITCFVPEDLFNSGSTMETVYSDFRMFGKIFDVEEKAGEVIAKMQQKIATVTDVVKDVDKKVKVFVYDSGSEDAFTAGGGLQSHLVELAGGENVFSDVNKTFATVSWEEVIARNPEYIVIDDYGDTTAEEKIEFLKTNEALKDVDAIKNEKFVVIPLSNAFEGVRNADTVEIFAKAFYPELFEGK